MSVRPTRCVTEPCWLAGLRWAGAARTTSKVRSTVRSTGGGVAHVMVARKYGASSRVTPPGPAGVSVAGPRDAPLFYRSELVGEPTRRPGRGHGLHRVGRPGPRVRPGRATLQPGGRRHGLRISPRQLRRRVPVWRSHPPPRRCRTLAPRLVARENVRLELCYPALRTH